MNDIQITPALWRCGLLKNPTYHVETQHGKNMYHKFTTAARDKLLESFPLNMDGTERKRQLNAIADEYKKQKK